MFDLKIWTPEECEPFETIFRGAVLYDMTDGDTFTLSVNVGFDIKGVLAKIRLLGENSLINPAIGVDCWETKGEFSEWGKAARARTTELLEGKDLRVYSRKGGTRGSLNRWLGLVLTPYGDGYASLGDILLKERHAVEWWRDRKDGALRPASPATDPRDTWSWATKTYQG